VPSDGSHERTGDAEHSAPRRLLFLGKRDDSYCRRALTMLQERVAHVEAHLGAWGEPLPSAARVWEGDVIVSYLSRWIVPASLLDRAPLSINFHPAPPEYPGIGCVNFALYDNAAHFGVTCHVMAPRVDTGPVIAVRRFPVEPHDDVASLLERTYAAQYELFLEIADPLVRGAPLPRSPETWARRAFTRKEFESLTELRPEMSEAEIRRRIRATSYGPYQPWVEIHGRRFVYRPGGNSSS